MKKKPRSKWTDADRIDADLMARVRDRDDPSALTELLPRVTPGIARVLRRCLPSSEIDDGLAVVHVRIWLKRHRYHPEYGTVRAWGCRIALNYCRDWARRMGRTPRRAADLDPSQCEDQRPGPAEIAEGADQMAALIRVVVHTLTTGSPLVLASFLLRLQGTGYAEIARQLNRPMGTVASAVRRFVTVLREQRSCYCSREVNMSEHINPNAVQAMLNELKAELAAVQARLNDTPAVRAHRLAERVQSLIDDPTQHRSSTDWAEIEDLVEALRPFSKALPKSLFTKVCSRLAEARELLLTVAGHSLALCQLRELVTMLTAVP